VTAIVGVLLGIGALLVASSLMWPTARAAERPRSKFATAARVKLAQAGLASVSIATVALVSLIFAVAAGAVSLAVFPVLAIAVAAATVALAIPAFVIVWRAQRQQRAARVVWPDVVDHLVSAVRSGLALPDSVMSLSHSGPTITRMAFSDFDRDYRLTGNFSDSLDRLKEALADPIADRIIETLRMSREVGGNELTTVLRNLAAYLRQDAALRAEVEARQSWILNAARLGVAAPWIVLLLLATRPEAAAAYNTLGGTILIVAGLAVTTVAYRLMRGLGRLPEEGRWFA
jgi:tight adherence protein B